MPKVNKTFIALLIGLAFVLTGLGCKQNGAAGDYPEVTL